MFLIWGINEKTKVLDYEAGVSVHQDCGQYARIQILMVYTYFSLFFIPLFRWNKRYYARYHCCKRMYELNKELGKLIEKKENPKIQPCDLSWIQ